MREKRICPKHGEVEFLRYRKKGAYYWRCCECKKTLQVKKQKDNKLRAIKHLGGKCLHCGFSDITRPEVFDFHHIDPSNKESVPSKLGSYSWERMKKEIDKCICLCANCHRTEHNGSSGGPSA